MTRPLSELAMTSSTIGWVTPDSRMIDPKRISSQTTVK
jgi:hypothetical protein